jgi:hypothetical protein
MHTLVAVKPFRQLCLSQDRDFVQQFPTTKEGCHSDLLVFWTLSIVRDLKKGTRT